MNVWTVFSTTSLDHVTFAAAYCRHWHKQEWQHHSCDSGNPTVSRKLHGAVCGANCTFAVWCFTSVQYPILAFVDPGMWLVLLRPGGPSHHVRMTLVVHGSIQLLCLSCYTYVCICVYIHICRLICIYTYVNVWTVQMRLGHCAWCFNPLSLWSRCWQD